MPDLDLAERARERRDHLFTFVTAVLLLRFAVRMWTTVAPGSWVGVIGTLYVLIAGVVLLYAGVENFDLERWGRPLAIGAGLALLIGMLTVWFRIPPQSMPDIQTDAMLFSRRGVDVLLSGQNPYAHDMSNVGQHYNATGLHITPRIDGSPTSAVSYPAGALWVFVPQALLGIGWSNLSLTTLGLTVFAFAFLIVETPNIYAVLPVGLALGARNYLWAGIGGILDILWIAPTLVAMRYWALERYGTAAFLVGLACGTKQQAWFYVPFLAIWLWNASDSWRDFGDVAAQTIGAGSAGFLLLNLPFMIWDLDAWLGGALFPIAGKVPLIPQGIGPTMLSTMGLYTLPKTWYTLLFGLGMLVAIVTYALYWEQLKWAAWIMPGALLMLPHRSLPSYIVFIVPIAYYALLCRHGLARSVQRRDLDVAST